MTTFVDRAVSRNLFKPSSNLSPNKKPAIIFLDLIIESKEDDLVIAYNAQHSTTLGIDEVVSNVFTSVKPEDIPFKKMLREILALKEERISVFPEIHCETNPSIQNFIECERTCYCTDTANPDCCCKGSAQNISFKDSFRGLPGSNAGVGVIAFWDCTIKAYDASGVEIIPNSITLFVASKGVRLIEFSNPSNIKYLEISNPNLFLEL